MVTAGGLRARCTRVDYTEPSKIRVEITIKSPDRVKIEIIHVTRQWFLGRVYIISFDDNTLCVKVNK